MTRIVRKIAPAQPPAVIRPRRVAAYARVSVPTERLLHSLDEQISYYSALIQSTPGWEYAGVFADRGVSGTQTVSRDEFQRMLSECTTRRSGTPTTGTGAQSGSAPANITARFAKPRI